MQPFLMKSSAIKLRPGAGLKVSTAPVLGGKYKTAKLLLQQQRDARRKAKGKGPAGKKRGALSEGLSTIAPLAGDIGEMINKYGTSKDWSWGDLVSDIFGKVKKYGDNFAGIFRKFLPMGVDVGRPYRTVSIANPSRGVKMLKFGAEQVGIASPFNIKAFDAPSITSGNGTYRIIHGDFLQPLQVPANTLMGEELFALDLTPQLGSWLARMSNFERYRIRHIAVTYNPQCPTTTAGSLAGVFETDISNLIVAGAGDATMKAVMSHAMSSICDVWTPHTWIFKPDDPLEWMYVARGGHEPRLEVAGQFRLLAGADFSEALKAALLTVTYDFEFKTAELQDIAVGTYDSIYCADPAAAPGCKVRLGHDAVYPTHYEDTDYDVNGGSLKIMRSPYLHLATSTSVSVSAAKECGLDLTKLTKLASVQDGPELVLSKSLLVSVPPGYWNISFFCRTDDVSALGLGAWGGYAAVVDPQKNVSGTINEVRSDTGATNSRVHFATGGDGTIASFVFRSNGHYKNGTKGITDYDTAINWDRPLQGILITSASHAFAVFDIFVSPISRIRSWTTTEDNYLRMKKLERRVEVIEKLEGDSTSSSSDVQAPIVKGPKELVPQRPSPVDPKGFRMDVYSGDTLLVKNCTVGPEGSITVPGTGTVPDLVIKRSKSLN